MGTVVAIYTPGALGLKNASRGFEAKGRVCAFPTIFPSFVAPAESDGQRPVEDPGWQHVECECVADRELRFLAAARGHREVLSTYHSAGERSARKATRVISTKKK